MEIGGNLLVAIIVVAVAACIAFQSWAEHRPGRNEERRTETPTED